MSRLVLAIAAATGIDPAALEARDEQDLITLADILNN